MEAKINTAHVQYELIMKVQEYINCHLFDELNSEELSQVAGMSKFHFCRLFKAVCGESLGKYVLRLRLEYIAFKLISTDISVPGLLSQIHYQNKHTLSRAFKGILIVLYLNFARNISMLALKERILYRLS